MTDYRDEIRAYENDAEERYDNYYEDYPEDFDEEDDSDSGFEGNEDSYYDNDEYEEVYDDDHDNYSAGSVGQIDSNDRTLTIVCTNGGTTDQRVDLFGGNRELAQHADVTVRVEESSHKEVQEDSKSSPFTITGLKLSVSNAQQLDQVIHVLHRSSTGKHSQSVYQPRNATSPQNLNPNMIDDSNFSMLVSGEDSLQFTLKAGVTVVFTLTISARANMRNVLKGRNVAEMATAPRTTGLPQLDLLRQKKPRPFGLKPRTRRRRLARRAPPRGGMSRRPMPLMRRR
jgi:hypothetical protein